MRTEIIWGKDGWASRVKGGPTKVYNIHVPKVHAEVKKRVFKKVNLGYCQYTLLTNCNEPTRALQNTASYLFLLLSDLEYIAAANTVCYIQHFKLIFHRSNISPGPTFINTLHQIEQLLLLVIQL